MRRRATRSAASLYMYSGNTAADPALYDDTLARRCRVDAVTLKELC
jgi:hypothetical protein